MFIIYTLLPRELFIYGTLRHDARHKFGISFAFVRQKVKCAQRTMGANLKDYDMKKTFTQSLMLLVMLQLIACGGARTEGEKSLDPNALTAEMTDIKTTREALAAWIDFGKDKDAFQVGNKTKKRLAELGGDQAFVAALTAHFNGLNEHINKLKASLEEGGDAAEGSEDEKKAIEEQVASLEAEKKAIGELKGIVALAHSLGFASLFETLKKGGYHFSCTAPGVLGEGYFCNLDRTEGGKKEYEKDEIEKAEETLAIMLEKLKGFDASKLPAEQQLYLAAFQKAINGVINPTARGRFRANDPHARFEIAEQLRKKTDELNDKLKEKDGELEKLKAELEKAQKDLENLKKTNPEAAEIVALGHHIRDLKGAANLLAFGDAKIDESNYENYKANPLVYQPAFEDAAEQSFTGTGQVLEYFQKEREMYKKLQEAMKTLQDAIAKITDEDGAVHDKLGKDDFTNALGEGYNHSVDNIALKFGNQGNPLITEGENGIPDGVELLALGLLASKRDEQGNPIYTLVQGGDQGTIDPDKVAENLDKIYPGMEGLTVNEIGKIEGTYAIAEGIDPSEYLKGEEAPNGLPDEAEFKYTAEVVLVKSLLKKAYEQGKEAAQQSAQISKLLGDKCVIAYFNHIGFNNFIEQFNLKAANRFNGAADNFNATINTSRGEMIIHMPLGFENDSANKLVKIPFKTSNLDHLTVSQILKGTLAIVEEMSREELIPSGATYGVYGFASVSSTVKHNENLSHERANYFAKQITESGLISEKLFSFGYGENIGGYHAPYFDEMVSRKKDINTSDSYVQSFMRRAALVIRPPEDKSVSFKNFLEQTQINDCNDFKTDQDA